MHFIQTQTHPHPHTHTHTHAHSRAHMEKQILSIHFTFTFLLTLNQLRSVFCCCCCFFREISIIMLFHELIPIYFYSFFCWLLLFVRLPSRMICCFFSLVDSILCCYSTMTMDYPHLLNWNKNNADIQWTNKKNIQQRRQQH